MNSSNDRKNNFGQAALKVAAFMVLLNAAVAGCAGSPDTKREANAPFSGIYEQIKVVGPVPDLQRVRIRKSKQQPAAVPQASVQAPICSADEADSIILVCRGDSSW